MAKRVLAIGGGLGSLSGAIRLANKGYDVKLFEKNEFLGGKMSEIRMDGFRFDTGPSLITMPFVIDELFRDVGEDRTEYLEFEAIEPLCRYFYPDGSILDASSDLDKMIQQLAMFNGTSPFDYKKYLNYSKQIYELTADYFLYNSIHEWDTFNNRQFLPTLLKSYKIDPFRTVHQANKKFFKDSRLVKLFDRYATYNGSNPYVAPATLNIIAHVEYGIGGYYIKGGIFKLVEALEKLAEKTGVQIFKNTQVDNIEHNGEKVKGILANGELIDGDYVLDGADVVYSFDDLIGGFDSQTKKLAKMEPSISGLVFLWGVKIESENLKHHNILFSEEYQQEFHQIFDDLEAPDDPTVYIAITSKKDKAHAPDSHENWFVLLNMPYLSENQDWNTIAAKMKKRVFEKLNNIGIDIRDKIVTEKVLTPKDFEQRYFTNKGSIYGLSSNSRSAAFRRPANRSRDLKGLFFAGGSSHPGGGVPLVMLSGKIASELIQKH